MQQEKKGLFGRLLDFWKEKTEEAGGGIGFWSGGKTEGKTLFGAVKVSVLPVASVLLLGKCVSLSTSFPCGCL